VETDSKNPEVKNLLTQSLDISSGFKTYTGISSSPALDFAKKLNTVNPTNDLKNPYFKTVN
jgi:hypothetical protein